MPIYEYHCEPCEHTFETLIRGNGDVARCPRCGNLEVAKQFSVPAAAHTGAPRQRAADLLRCSVLRLRPTPMRGGHVRGDGLERFTLGLITLDTKRSEGPHTSPKCQRVNDLRECTRWHFGLVSIRGGHPRCNPIGTRSRRPSDRHSETFRRAPAIAARSQLLRSESQLERPPEPHQPARPPKPLPRSISTGNPHSSSLTISSPERITSWLADHAEILSRRTSRRVAAEAASPDDSSHSDGFLQPSRAAMVRSQSAVRPVAGGRTMAGHPGHGRGRGGMQAPARRTSVETPTSAAELARRSRSGWASRGSGSGSATVWTCGSAAMATPCKSGCPTISSATGSAAITPAACWRPPRRSPGGQLRLSIEVRAEGEPPLGDVVETAPGAASRGDGRRSRSRCRAIPRCRSPSPRRRTAPHLPRIPPPALGSAPSAGPDAASAARGRLLDDDHGPIRAAPAGAPAGGVRGRAGQPPGAGRGARDGPDGRRRLQSAGRPRRRRAGQDASARRDRPRPAAGPPGPERDPAHRRGVHQQLPRGDAHRHAERLPQPVPRRRRH